MSFDKVELPRIKKQYPPIDAKAMIEARGDDDVEGVMDRLRKKILPLIGRKRQDTTDEISC